MCGGELGIGESGEVGVRELVEARGGRRNLTQNQKWTIDRSNANFNFVSIFNEISDVAKVAVYSWRS